MLAREASKSCHPLVLLCACPTTIYDSVVCGVVGASPHVRKATLLEFEDLATHLTSWIIGNMDNERAGPFYVDLVVRHLEGFRRLAVHVNVLLRERSHGITPVHHDSLSRVVQHVDHDAIH